ncbi:two-component regulator propeller domain-containing protein [Candidatus Parabeggiatoa sp. HSG14]|uniref:two-component regulator propeller domain-containing protein n=1 Tax=Candidatus Parabeggiatoa sp. HSG14 TaxID=3055593 RepID=UPI0025A7F9CE|nr:two-component regulator propeller domain-containing protein [Thiotrichales bacterium HSG14]
MKISSQILISILFFIFTLLTSSILFAQDNPTIKFEHLNVEDGLPSNFTINAIQDDQGFMWFATKNGLAKYDGIEFTVYRQESDNPNSLSNNYVWSILKDHNGTLWASTLGGGINKFDPITETFTRYQHDDNNPNSLVSDIVLSACEDKTGILWIATDSGFSRFDPNHETFTNYQHNKNDNSLSENYLFSIYPDDNGILWIGTFGGGLNKFDPATETFTHYQHDENNPNSLINNSIFKVYGDEGTLWIATTGGLDHYNPNSDTFTHYQHDKNNPNSLSLDSLVSIFKDSNGILWIGTTGGGLNQFDSANNRFNHYQYEPSNPNSLSDNSVFATYEDINGTLWIMTQNGGINKYDPGSHRFAHYQHHPLKKNGLNNNQIGAIHEDKNGILWIGTKGGGLNKFDRQTNTFTHYQQDDKNINSISNNVVTAIHPDSSGALWMGIDGGGLNRFDPKTETFVHYPTDPNDPDMIWDIDIDLMGNIWIAYIGAGLDKLNPKNKTVVHYHADGNNPNSLMTNWISAVKVASNGMVWVGTDEIGASQFDPTNNTFIHYLPDEKDPKSLSNGVVSTIFEDSKGRIWIGTYDGLNRFNPENQTFTIYNDKHGLAGNSIAGILEDEQGYLWISTNNGLSQFNPQTETCRNYDKRDGLQGNLFFPHSAYKSVTGELFFGGSNGFNAYYPDKLFDNQYIPPVVLTDFQVFNKSVSIGKKSPLQKHINLAEQITLSYEQSVFRFKFAALNYRASDKNQYAYMMEGFDIDWTYVDSNQRFAIYTNLDAGEYTFRVKASNNDGLWNEKGTSIKVIILPPWWQTWYAYTLYAIIILGSILGFFMAQQRKLTHSRIINERLQEADRLKDEFLANTSHELRTPLNGIIGIAESLIDGAAGSLSEPVKKNLLLVTQSGHRLTNLINDILDFSKLQHKDIELQAKPISLREIVEIVLMLSQPLKGQKELQFVNAITADLPPVLADENRIQQILYNLVGNAIKFTERGTIKISAKACTQKRQTTNHLTMNPDNCLIITVSDTGIGIPANKLNHIFEAFEQAEGSTARDYGGTGLGLAVTKKLVALHHGKMWVESTPDVGSQFMFTLPIANQPASSILNQSILLTRLAQMDTQKSSMTVTSPSSFNTSQGEFKILIVDDEPVNLQVLVNHLSLNNYAVVQASSGPQALQLLKEGLQPDLILLDVMMPKMTGYEVMQKIRDVWAIHELPTLLLTAKNQLSDLVAGLNAGANDYLTKPISKDELLARIKTHLNIKRLKAENVRLSTELDITRRLQQMLLPTEKELKQIDGLDIAGFMEPADEVGGDYYDVLQHSGRILFGIGDVTGHGLESGALAIMVQSSVRTLLANNETDPVKFFSALNQMVFHNVQRMNVEKSLTLALVDYKENQLYISGQHEEVIVVRNGELELIDTIDLGFPIGLDDNIADFIAEAKISLNTGDVVVLYTDGITEAENLNKQMYEQERLCEVIQQNWQQTAHEIQKAVIEDVRQFIGEQKVYDDITLLVLKKK